MQQLAARRGVPLHLHTIIYQLVQQLRDELSARLPPLTSHSVLGESSTPAHTARVHRLSRPLLSCVSSWGVQARPRSWPPSTSPWGRGRSPWPAAVSRRDSWTAARGSGWCEDRTPSGRVRLTLILDRGQTRDLVWLLLTLSPCCPCPPAAGSLATLKQHKDDVQTVQAGMECGLSAEGDAPFRAGDVIICFQEVQVPQVTSWDPGF